MSKWIRKAMPFVCGCFWGWVLYALWQKDPLFGMCFMLGWVALGTINSVTETYKNV